MGEAGKTAWGSPAPHRRVAAPVRNCSGEATAPVALRRAEAVQYPTVFRPPCSAELAVAVRPGT
jgi:hypothetical protein